MADFKRALEIGAAIIGIGTAFYFAGTWVSDTGARITDADKRIRQLESQMQAVVTSSPASGPTQGRGTVDPSGSPPQEGGIQAGCRNLIDRFAKAVETREFN